MERTRRPSARTAVLFAALLLVTGGSRLASHAGSPSSPPPTSPDSSHYHPAFRPPPAIEAIERFLPAGSDAFPEEKTAEALAATLSTLGAAIRQHPTGIAAAAGPLLAPQFKGGRLVAGESATASGALEIAQSGGSAAATLDRATFHQELTALVAAFRTLDVAEFLITHIEADAGTGVRTVVRFDLSGLATAGGRTERIGQWQIRWQEQAGHWAISEWTALASVSSRAAAPVFSEATYGAFGGIQAFATQLTPNLDDWISRVDSAFVPGGMGHHGVSAGDVDGDGLDDLYVAQPSRVPNLLFRNNGDGAVSDITDAPGLGVLDSTTQTLFVGIQNNRGQDFVDIDNDGDEDLVLITRAGPLLFTNDGKAHFSLVPNAFQLAHPLRGTLTSAAAADYDRDGFVDLYLCAYSFVIGASEDKAGPP